MSPLPYAHPWDWVLYGLAVLDLSLLIGGLSHGHLDADKTVRLPRALRMALSAILVVAALIGWRAGARGTAAESFAAFVASGMLAGFVGDLVMARVIPTRNRLVSGMAAFGLGHLLYIAGLLSLLVRSRMSSGWTAWAIQIVLLSFAGCSWSVLVRRTGGSRVINLGSLVYALLIAEMVALAILLALLDAHYFLLACGAVLFLCSDLVLGNWQVKGHSWNSVNDVIWCLYTIGQLLIVYSVAAAVRVLS
jgi:hypothetical protein